MLVETVDQWRELAAGLPRVRLALDVGHCLVMVPAALEALWAALPSVDIALPVD